MTNGDRIRAMSDPCKRSIQKDKERPMKEVERVTEVFNGLTEAITEQPEQRAYQTSVITLLYGIASELGVIADIMKHSTGYDPRGEE